MESYEKMLDVAYSQIKNVSSAGERFEMPKIDGRFEGKRTILTNFGSVAAALRRDVNHIQKFMLKELAVSGGRDGDRLILNKKVPRKNIDAKIEQYAKEFVICRECGKPDTEIIKKDRINMLKCLACGSTQPIRGKI